MDIESLKSYLSLPNKIEFDDSVSTELKSLKLEAISNSNEDLANELWCLDHVLKIQMLFVMAYNNIKQGKHFNAWLNYEQIEIKFSSLRKHLNYNHNKYNLEFIEELSQEYQKLFPYKHFVSRESIIKKRSCSICGRTISIRSQCEHKLGELYMGEMCYHNILEFEGLALAIVTNPFDKYTVLFPDGMEYDYAILDNLFTGLLTPYDRWNLSIERKIKPEYEHVKRNSKCPCGLNKKYKNCCYLSGEDSTEHYKFTLLDNPNAQRIPYISVGTWKNENHQ